MANMDGPSAEQLMRKSKAQMVSIIMQQREIITGQRAALAEHDSRWADSESGTPVYDSIAHLDPREEKPDVPSTERTR